MIEGLVKVDLPGSPRGYQFKCVYCRCSVSTTHQPGSLDCLQSETERSISQSDPS